MAMMKLGLFMMGEGHHVAAWRDPGVRSGTTLDIQHFVDIAKTGERGRFDFLFTADTNAIFYGDDLEQLRRTTSTLRLEPLTLLSALAMVTDHIGLICTATTTYLDPFHVARQFASLDQISGGRAGWNLVTSSAPAEAANFSHDAHPDYAHRYERAAEFAQVVMGLWDSWEDDGIIDDRESGIYFDPEKLHRLNHKGKYFSVRGPLTIQRSPQGRPIIVQAGQSEQGRALAAETAEVIFTVQQDLGEARAFYTDIKSRAATFGRAPGEINVMPGLLPVIGKTRRAAEERLDRINSLIDPELGLTRLSNILGMDLSPYPLDGPLPEIPPSVEQQGRQTVVIDLARRENLTIRQLYQQITGVRGHRVLCGTADEIADSMEEWFQGGAADGFNIMALTYPEGLDDFVDQVIPILQRRGLFRTEYESRTMRGNLGLAIPENRWARKAPTA
jgi:N-acetyl-S-(2-succino)cysteine monooxygenase